MNTTRIIVMVSLTVDLDIWADTYGLDASDTVARVDVKADAQDHLESTAWEAMRAFCERAANGATVSS